MGGGASKSPVSSVESKGPKPAFSSKQALKQIKKIDRVAPRKKLEGQSHLPLRVGNVIKQVPFAYVSQTGYYPDELDKANQDALVVREDLGSKDNRMAFFGVFDGHGKVGDLCSNFVKEELWEALEADEDFAKGNLYKGLVNAHVTTNQSLHEQERNNSFSDLMSGTTAISCLLHEDSVFVSNVGDSRAIAIVEETPGKLESLPLSIDQTPFRKDERERVKKCGARVLTMAQLEGFQDPDIQEFGNEEENDGDPPRLWTKMGSYPGTAFTRSLGDRIAEDIGVCAIPEVLERKLTSQDKYILLASDGVFEFITSQGVVDIFSRFRKDLLNASRAIVAEAYRQWLQFETRTDDITCMIIDVSDIGQSAMSADEVKKRKGSSAINFLVYELQEQFTKNAFEKRGPLADKISQAAIGANSTEDPREKKAIDAAKRKTSIKLDESFKLDSKRVQMMGLELRPVRRKVANNVGVVPFDPAELEGYELPVYDKSEEEKTSIRIAIQNNYLFAHLNEDQLEKAILAMQKEEVEPAQVIIEQFAKGDKFYVATSGRYVVEVAVNKMITDPTGKQVPVHGEYEEPREVMEYNADEGGFHPSFGELALMYNKPRAATVKSVCKGTLWSLERKAFHSILMRDSAHRLVKVLRKVKTFESLTYNEIARLVDLLTEVHVKAGEFIVRQGEEGDSFYVIKKGQAVVTIEDEDGTSKEVMQLAEYEYFGERALLNSAPRAANVIAKEDTTCLMIKKSLFDEVLGRLQQVLQHDGREREAVAEKYSQIKSLSQLKVFPGEIPFFSGMLYRCALRAEYEKEIEELEQNPGAQPNHQHYCTLRRILLPSEEAEKEETMKLLDKEISILRKIATPLLVAEFQHDSNNLIRYQLFKEEFVTDMQTIITERPLDPSSNMLKYAIKTISIALIELHENRGILYRGIAPEGILMDPHGRLILTDFRYAKVTNGLRTFTACGTPEYMAPEQIKGLGHGFAADWWALGVLMCELCTGSTPWANKSEVEIYEAITDPLAVQLQIGRFARMLEAPGIKLLRSLLTDEPDKRLSFKHEEDFEQVPFLARVRVKESPFANFAKGLEMKRTNNGSQLFN